MQEENTNTKYVVYNDKKIALSSLTFQTRQLMQRQNELQQEVARLQMAMNENQLLVTQYSKNIQEDLDKSSEEIDELEKDTGYGLPWSDKEQQIQ